MGNSLSQGIPEDHGIQAGGAIINSGAVLAVLLVLPCIFIGLFGAAGVVSGSKLIAGALGACWGYAAAAGTYELNRRKFNWSRGAKYRDHHLLAGTIAVSTGLMISGALHETMPALAIVPALAAIKQAHDGHPTHLLTVVHTLVLLAGIVIGIWFYVDGVVGAVLLQGLAELP